MPRKSKINISISQPNTKKYTNSFDNYFLFFDKHENTIVIFSLFLIFSSYYYFIQINPSRTSVNKNIEKIYNIRQEIDSIEKNENKELQKFKFESEKLMIEKLLRNKIPSSNENNKDTLSIIDIIKIVIRLLTTILKHGRGKLENEIINDINLSLDFLSNILNNNNLTEVIYIKIDNESKNPPNNKKGTLYHSIFLIINNKIK